MNLHRKRQEKLKWPKFICKFHYSQLTLLAKLITES